ncbi:MAG: hypothetical protein HYV07_10950 [Deltaproteobacteria bacterium]|nr:hypothetical protein [Deltaproteobacteria bacterium]
MDDPRLFEDIALGKKSVAELAGLDPKDLERIEGLGVSAFSSGRFEKAATIFAGLEALDPKRPQHALHLAHAFAQGGHSGLAIDAFSRFLDVAVDSVEPSELIRALLARALLYVSRQEDERAQSDLSRARELAGEDASLKKLVEEFGRDRASQPPRGHGDNP